MRTYLKEGIEEAAQELEARKRDLPDMFEAQGLWNAVRSEQAFCEVLAAKLRRLLNENRPFEVSEKTEPLVGEEKEKTDCWGSWSNGAIASERGLRWPEGTGETGMSYGVLAVPDGTRNTSRQKRASIFARVATKS